MRLSSTWFLFWMQPKDKRPQKHCALRVIRSISPALAIARGHEGWPPSIFAKRASMSLIANTSKSRRKNPSVPIDAASLCRSGLFALVKRLLPVAPVEIIKLELAEIHPFQASHVDVECIRIGSR